MTPGRKLLMQTLVSHFAWLESAHPRKAAAPVVRKAHRFAKQSLRKMESLAHGRINPLTWNGKIAGWMKPIELCVVPLDAADLGFDRRAKIHRARHSPLLGVAL